MSVGTFGHDAAPLGQRHPPHNWEYADAAARTAATGMVPGDVTKWAKQLDDGTYWELTDDAPVTWAQRTGTGGGGAVDSVNGQTGIVVLDADDISDSGTTNQFATAAELTKLAGIEALADVTDATNVAAAGAVMESDTSTAAMSFVTDEDDMASDSATKVPTQQSVKAFVMAMLTGLIDFKDSVRVATAAALPANTRTGNVLTATANGALAAVDGVTLAVNDRLLVKNEATGANNGLYVVTAVGDASNPFVLTRSADANASGEVTGGLYVFATEGTANADNGFILTTNDPIVLNTTALTFAVFGVTGSYNDEQAQDAVGGILTDSSSIDFSYDDTLNTITAAVILEWLQDTVAAMFTGGTHTAITATYQDPGGVIDLAATAGASEPPFPMALYAKRRGSTVVNADGGLPDWTVVSGVGNSDDGSTGPWMKLPTSATINSGTGMGTGSYAALQREWLSVVIIKARTDDVTNVRYWVGTTSGQPSASATPALHIAGFRFDTGAGDTHWQAVTDDGAGSPTLTDTGVTPSAAGSALFEVRFGASDVKFYINNTLVATHTTDLPGSSQTLGIHVWVTNLAAVSKAISMQWMKLYPLGR